MTRTTGRLPIICLAGPMGGGKSTVAGILEEQGFARFSMAGPLKDMLKAMGLTHRDVYGPQHHRATPMPFLCGKSPRYAMQTLGTEWGRKLIGEDLWVNATQERIIKHQTLCATRQKTGRGDATGCKGIVIEDSRFHNEWAMGQRLGGVVWTVRRPGVERPRTLADRLYFKVGGTLGQLAGKFLDLMRLSPLTHESEYYWRDAPSDVVFWNTGTLEDLRSQVLELLARLTPPEGKAEQEKETAHA